MYKEKIRKKNGELADEKNFGKKIYSFDQKTFMRIQYMLQIYVYRQK